MRYKFFSNSEKTWRAMFQAISGARESIYMEMYMFHDNIENLNFSLLLKEKARSGARVKIILDSLGSRGFTNENAKEFKEAGIELFFISHYIHRTHRKILVIDETTAFLGGVNFSQSAKLWDDLSVEIKGKIVKYITSSFAKAYQYAGGKDPKVLSARRPLLSTRTHTWLIEHFPVRNKFSLKKIYKKNIREAKENVTIITPYFTPRRWLMASLHQAVIRGVEVEILIPKKTDIFIVDRINYFFISKLSKLGIKFYINPKMNHAKAMVIDHKVGIVGSHNLDLPSFELNDEIGIFLKDQEAVKKLSDIARMWRAESYLFSSKDSQSYWIDYLIFPFAAFYSRFI